MQESGEFRGVSVIVTYPSSSRRLSRLRHATACIAAELYFVGERPSECRRKNEPVPRCHLIARHRFAATAAPLECKDPLGRRYGETDELSSSRRLGGKHKVIVNVRYLRG